MLVDGENGLLVKRKINSLARGIEKLMLSDELRRKFSRNGSEYIKKFDWRNLADRILQWYENQERSLKNS
jgi:glycosyltransferase involved in cell wall biosynthesis